jgi:hypothetical protein
VNGDEVRDARFLSHHGYDAAQVDDLLGRLAVELGAGRPAGPLIANAAFRWKNPGFDIDAVDWFLDQLLRREEGPESAGMSADPWRDLAVVNQFARRGPGDLDDRTSAPSRRAHRNRTQDQEYLARECADAWRDFGHQPGVHLWWGRTKSHHELRTTGLHTIASLRGYGRASTMWWGYSRGYGPPLTIGVGGRNFTFKKRGTARSPSPDVAAITARSTQDHMRYAAAEKTSGQERQRDASSQKPRGIQRLTEPRELVDETGTPILYVSGRHDCRRATANITFPNQRYIRFPVRGTRRSNAIMTAVDQAGNKIARYRITRSDSGGQLVDALNGVSNFFGVSDFFAFPVEITVHPDQQLTDELVLTIAISAPWLSRYFYIPGEGGG